MRIILFLFSFSLFSFSFAQKKELTLSESVLQQYRALGADKMQGFSWVPNTAKYSFLKDKYTVLYVNTVKDTSVLLKISITEINAVLGTDFRNFFGYSWKNEQNISLHTGSKYYEFNIITKTGKKTTELPENVENVDYLSENDVVAFTQQNNLFIQKNGALIPVTSNSDKNIVSGKFFARNEFGISKGTFWSPNANLIAFYQKDETDVHNYPLLDIESTPGELISIKYPMAGQKSEKPKVGIYDLRTKKTVFITPRGKSDDYLTNLAWTPDEKQVVIVELNRGQNHFWVNVYDAVTGEFVRSLFDEKNEKWVEPENPVFFPSKTSNNFIWISQRDGFNNLYYYDWNGKLKQQLTYNKFVTKNIVGTINKGAEVVFMATGESPLDMNYFAVNLKGKQRLITKSSGTHTLQIGLDGNYFMDEYSSHSVPSKSLLLNAKGDIVKELLVASDKLADYKIGVTEISSIQALDGTKLYTRLIKPSNFDPTKKYPVMVYVYGGPHAQMIQNEWLDGSNLWMHWMAEKGYLVFTLDNRGSGYRGFAFESGIHRQLGTIEIEDQLQGVKHLKSLPFVDSTRLAVHGWSFGGFMTTSLMLRKPGTFKVGVAGGPVTDWKFYEIMYGERYMDLPEENVEGYKNACLMNYTKNLKGNLLLIHGTVDDVVVMQHNYSLIKQFVEDGIQMDFFPYPMHPHNVMGKDRVHLIEKILTYILKNNN
jgi:dipeptidyl-peptidase-4